MSSALLPIVVGVMGLSGPRGCSSLPPDSLPSSSLPLDVAFSSISQDSPSTGSRVRRFENPRFNPVLCRSDRRGPPDILLNADLGAVDPGSAAAVGGTVGSSKAIEDSPPTRVLSMPKVESYVSVWPRAFGHAEECVDLAKSRPAVFRSMPPAVPLPIPVHDLYAESAKPPKFGVIVCLPL